MSCTHQQAVRDADSSLGDTFESIIEDFTEDIETVETGDIEIGDTTTPTMVNSSITWGDIHGEEVVYVFSKPNIGGLFADETITDKETWVLIPFVGSNPDATTKVWSW